MNAADSLILRMLAYMAPLVPLPPGGMNSHFSQEVRVGHGDYRTLNFSVLSYKLNQGDGIRYYSRQSGSVFNEFNEEVIARLGRQDTLAIQEFFITFTAD